MSQDDPYNDVKKVHKAGLMNNRGGVSAVCYSTPRPINMNRECWTLTDSYVTCAKCLEAMGIPDAKAEAKRRRQKQMDFIISKASPSLPPAKEVRP